MKKLFLGLFLLFFSISIVSAQLEVKIVKEYENGAGEISVVGKTYDEVWNGVIRGLMNLKYRVKESNKDAGSIFAEKKPGVFYEKGDMLASWDIQITEENGMILIVASFTEGEDPVLSEKKGFVKFYEKLKEILEKKFE